MSGGALPAWEAMSEEQSGRWAELLDGLAGMLPAGAVCVLVDGGPYAAVFADRLATRLSAGGRRCARRTNAADTAERSRGSVTLADRRARPPAGGWDVVIRLRTTRVADEAAERDADIVVDLHEAAWPVIRHVVRRLAGRSPWYIAESRAFFGPRAATWDTRFGDDMPAYAAAVAEAAIPAGATALDVGCGTGRALPALRDAVGPDGVVIGLDITPQMLAVARSTGRARGTVLLLADARHLPLRDGAVDAVFAASARPGRRAHGPGPRHATGRKAGRLPPVGPRRPGRTARPDPDAGRAAGRGAADEPARRRGLAAGRLRRPRPPLPGPRHPLPLTRAPVTGHRSPVTG